MFAIQRLVAVLVLFVTLASSVCLAKGKPTIRDCYDESNVEAVKICRNVVAAIYQAIQVVQVEHGMTSETCQFGEDIGIDELMERMRPIYFDMPESTMGMEIVPMTIAAILAPAECPLGLALRVGGLSAGQVLKVCQEEMSSGDPPMACTAYAAGIRDVLNLFSCRDGTDAIMCLPKGKIELKRALSLYVGEN